MVDVLMVDCWSLQSSKKNERKAGWILTMRGRVVGCLVDLLVGWSLVECLVDVQTREFKLGSKQSEGGGEREREAGSFNVG